MWNIIKKLFKIESNKEKKIKLSFYSYRADNICSEAISLTNKLIDSIKNGTEYKIDIYDTPSHYICLCHIYIGNMKYNVIWKYDNFQYSYKINNHIFYNDLEKNICDKFSDEIYAIDEIVYNAFSLLKKVVVEYIRKKKINNNNNNNRKDNESKNKFTPKTNNPKELKLYENYIKRKEDLSKIEKQFGKSSNEWKQAANEINVVVRKFKEIRGEI